MLSNAKLPFLLSLTLLFLLWKEAQGRCSSCPSNGCSQTGMSQGKCYRARYYSTSYQTSYYVTTYYRGTSQGSSTYRCGSWLRRRRCTRYHTNYHQVSRSSLRYGTGYSSNRACDAYCCPRHINSNGHCRVICDIPRSLANGQKSYSSRTVGSRVTYTCNSWYLMTSGSSSRTCQSNHQWSGTHPTCTVNCGTPSSLSNGQSSYSGTTVGYTVTYTCNTGYLRTAGSSRRTCQSNHQWSGTHPTCTVDCGTPSSSSNGQSSYSGTTVGYTVTYTCNTGYLRTAGSSRRTCQSNHQWSGTHPTCTAVPCGTPSSLSNGQRRYTSTTVGSRVTYTCNTGYLRTAGSSSRTCLLGGRWSGSHPTCSVNCGTPSSLSNGQSSYSSTTVGYTVTYTCNTGYRMTSGSSRRTCQSNHQWSGTHPTCTVNTNGDIQLIGGSTSRQGRVEIWYNRQWNTVCDDSWDINDAHVVCRQLGYRGAVTAHQSAHFGPGSGQILLDDLQCTGREASLLECSHSGINSHNCGHGEDASVTCTSSRFSNGSSRLANGSVPSVGRVELWYSEQWNTVCDDSWDINEATVVCRQLGYRGAVFAHKSAYFGQGSGRILLDELRCSGTETSLFQCPHNGLYRHDCVHGEDAGVTCGCGDPGTRAVITRNISGTAVGDTVTYTCPTGYTLSGSSSRTCQTNGYWSGNLPNCNILPCGTPSSLSNGQTHYTSTNVGSTVTYTCNTGYRMTAGSSSRTCLFGGHWSVSHPTCSIVNCSIPSRPDNGQFYYVGRSYNDRVNFSCNLGYLLTGTSLRTCQFNGQWSGTQPSCNPLLTTVWFTETYQQMKKEDGTVTICLMRNRNLHREDTVSVVTGNYTNTLLPKTLVTFEVGSSETCFNFSFVVSNDALDSEHLTLSIMNTTSRTEVEKGLGTVVIHIVDKDSPCSAGFLFAETPVNSLAEFPCSLLDDNFLPGGVITAQCSANSTWDALDMSQCTFRNDVQVATVAVVDVHTSSAMQEETIEGILESLPQVTNVSKIQSTSQVYTIRANSEIDEGVLRQLQSMATTVLLARKANYCNCCDYSAIKIQPIFVSSARFDVCIGSYEAPQACSCSAEGLKCFPRFSLSLDSVTGARCYLDADGDRKLDMQDPCVGCCLADFDRTFQWPETPHNTFAELPCSIIHSSFSDTNVQRKCLSDDSWEPADISSCTFKNTTRNPIYLLTTNMTLSSEKNNTETIEAIKRAFEKQISKLAEKGETLTNSSYEITTTTITNGANESIVLLVVEFQPSVNLTENTTAITAVTDPFNGATYAITKIIAARPSESCSCRAGASQVAHLCVGPSSSPCDCNSFQTCECIDPYVKDATNGECSLDTDGDNLPDYRDSCPDRYGSVKTGGCPTSISNSLVVKCPMEQDELWLIQWPFAAPGSTQSVRCPGEGDASGLGLAHRSCLAGGMWGAVDVTACESPAVREVRIETKNLLTDLNQTIAYGLPILEAHRVKVKSISVNLRNALNQSRERSVLPTDLETAASFVEIVANLSKNNGLFDDNSQEIEKSQQRKVIADVVSSLLEERNAPAFEVNTKSSATRILKATEGIADAITSSLDINNPRVTISRRNIGLHGTRLPFNNVHTRGNLRFPDNSVKLPEFGRPANIPHIKLPAAFISAASQSRGEALSGENGTMTSDTVVEVVNVVMNNIEDYLPDAASDDVNESGAPSAQAISASLVLSSQISGYDGREFIMDNNESVELTFPIKEEALNAPVPAGYVKQFHCAFFNFTGAVNNTGAWSYRGMRFINFNGTHVQCKASHLTSFAVLVSIVPSEDLPPLDYITYIGCSISFLCLIGAIIFFLCLRKELIQKVHNFVHLNLCIALALGLLLFLTGVQTATANEGACKFVTALLHYFFLATFTWTLCEAVLIYNLLVKVFGANDRKWLYIYLAVGWVAPIPVVVISAAIRHDHYLIRYSHDEGSPHYNEIKACWLPSDKGMIFAFVGPMIAIIVVNATLLTVSLVSLAKSQCGKVGGKKDKEQTEQYLEVGKRLLKATVILIPLLGFTWIIGLFAVGAEGRVFAYLFVIANVFQGLFIFLFHVARHEKVWGKIKTKLPKRKERSSERSGTNANTTATLARSTGKPEDFNSSKSCASVHSTAANVDCGAELEYSRNDQYMRMDDFMSSTVDDARIANEYDIPSSIAATAFTGEAVYATDEPVYENIQ